MADQSHQVYAVAAELAAATIEYHRTRLAQVAKPCKATDRAARNAYQYMVAVQNELNQLCLLEACE